MYHTSRLTRAAQASRWPALQAPRTTSLAGTLRPASHVQNTLVRKAGGSASAGPVLGGFDGRMGSADLRHPGVVTVRLALAGQQLA